MSSPQQPIKIMPLKGKQMVYLYSQYGPPDWVNALEDQ